MNTLMAGLTLAPGVASLVGADDVQNLKNRLSAGLKTPENRVPVKGVSRPAPLKISWEPKPDSGAVAEPIQYPEDIKNDGSHAFVVGGVNKSEDIVKMKSITGLDFDTLDARMTGDGYTWASFDFGSHEPNPEYQQEWKKMMGLDGVDSVKENSWPKSGSTESWNGATHYDIRHSGPGFIEKGQSVRDLLVKDNDWVLNHGLTHQEVADPLIKALKKFEASGVKVNMDGAVKKVNIEMVYKGEKYQIETQPVGGWYGIDGGFDGVAPQSGPVGHSHLQGSPFNDDYFTNYVISITNKKTKKKIVVDGLTPYLIQRYGFYQGGEFRLAPHAIVDFFHLK